MIPILYSKTENSWTSNGLGRLSDAASCVVTEERNGIFELEMSYPMTGVHFNDIQVDCYIKTICNAKRQFQLFRVYSITKPINGKCTIRAEHVSYQMLHIPVMPFTAVGASATLQALRTNAVGDCPFTFWTDNTSQRKFTLNYPKSMRGTLQGDQWSIMQNYGGDYEWDNFSVKLWMRRGVDHNVVLRYGKNITDLKQEENIQKTYTGIIPYWYSMEGENPVLVTLPEVVLYSENAQNFPYSRILPVDFADQIMEKPSVSDLRTAGEYYIQRNEIGIPAVSISLDFVDLSQTEEYKDLSIESLNLCDYVTVQFLELGVSKKARITRTKYDVLRERYTNLYIGESYHSLASIIADNTVQTSEVAQSSTNFMINAINQATKTLNGEIIGSRMETLTDADGNPQGLIIMDTNNPATAVNCIRINTNGIGFSNNGVNGPYNSAWLINNTFNAAEINVINLNASSITTGTIQDDTGNNWWNLDTGEVHLSAVSTLEDGLEQAQTSANEAQTTATNALNNAAAANSLAESVQNLVRTSYVTTSEYERNAASVQSTFSSVEERIGHVSDISDGYYDSLSNDIDALRSSQTATNQQISAIIADQSSIEQTARAISAEVSQQATLINDLETYTENLSARVELTATGVDISGGDTTAKTYVHINGDGLSITDGENVSAEFVGERAYVNQVYSYGGLTFTNGKNGQYSAIWYMDDNGRAVLR